MLDSNGKTPNIGNSNFIIWSPKKSNVEISNNSSKCSTAMGKLKYWEFVDFTKFLAQFLGQRAVRVHRADIPTVTTRKVTNIW